MTSFMGSSRKDIPGIAAADSSDSQKGGDVNEVIRLCFFIHVMLYIYI